MDTMALVDAHTGETLDTVGIDAGGVTTYVTGEAAPVLAALTGAYEARGLAPLSLVDELDGWTDGRVRLDAAPVVLEAGWVPPLPTVLVDLREAGSDRKLRAYWVRGEGAAKIGWNRPGDFETCVAHLGKYVRDPKGLCAEYHKAATGEWPGKKAHGG
ncbi:hypothetical protein ACIBTV_27855 [Micromonospora sp. NPDC049366]|uniref:hypothetical protein n=1 Tax=Micromonospora sp. NPDC049366 TaxID=3364271 RepID=UPI0037BAC098